MRHWLFIFWKKISKRQNRKNEIVARPEAKQRTLRMRTRRQWISFYITHVRRMRTKLRDRTQRLQRLQSWKPGLAPWPRSPPKRNRRFSDNVSEQLPTSVAWRPVTKVTLHLTKPCKTSNNWADTSRIRTFTSSLFEFANTAMHLQGCFADTAVFEAHQLLPKAKSHFLFCQFQVLLAWSFHISRGQLFFCNLAVHQKLPTRLFRQQNAVCFLSNWIKLNKAIVKIHVEFPNHRCPISFCLNIGYLPFRSVHLIKTIGNILVVTS